jgi:hypothetical protein
MLMRGMHEAIVDVIHNTLCLEIYLDFICCSITNELPLAQKVMVDQGQISLRVEASTARYLPALICDTCLC